MSEAQYNQWTKVKDITKQEKHRYLTEVYPVIAQIHAVVFVLRVPIARWRVLERSELARAGLMNMRTSIQKSMDRRAKLNVNLLLLKSLLF